SSGLFQQMYNVDLSTSIFHQEFDANLDDSLTSFDLKTVRFNVDKSSPSVSLSMNAVASHTPAFAPAVTADGEMGVADTFGMSIYQNPLSVNDVNGDSQVTPNDALIIINHLNSGATQRLDALQLVDSLNVSGFIDTNGDYNSSPIDVLQVINQLNAMTTDVVVDQGAEGEGFVTATIRVPMLLQDTDTAADLHFESLDAVDPVDVDFGFDLNEQRGSVTAESATWSTEVDELYGDDDLDDLLEVLQN
ncbi:MAG: dockerin type I domain-containing protein, partial [Pirellulaceae bacterium]|nr:dockerin type I domain-containing protein [Pirellulaceae bacterium]